MMQGMTGGIAVLIAGFVITSSCFGGEEQACPEKVRLASGTIVSEDVPSELKPVISGSITRLTGVTIFDGPPEDGAILKPSSFSSRGKTIKWDFARSKEKGIWLSCDYAEGLIRLVKQVAETTSSCTAVIRPTEPHKNLSARFTCR